MMERPKDDDGYEPDSAICLTEGITNRKLKTYDDLYETTIASTPFGRTFGRTVAAKRKSPGASILGQQDASAKRARLEGQQEVVSSAQTGDSWQRGGERLPAEVWQHILTYLSPRQLGNLLAVNRFFHLLLHPSPRPSLQDFNPVPTPTSPKCVVPFLKPDAIWQSSRRVFYPGMPAPLKGKSELDMWRIVCGRLCQFCGDAGVATADEPTIGQIDPWYRGPGAKGVSPVFPFGIITCGRCLIDKSVKELDLILSSVPSALHPALPAAFVTSDLNVITPATLQHISDFSSQEKPSRIYWPEHIEQVKTEFESVRSLGSAAAEEWLKGLDARGKKALVDASRWEKWELAGGRARLRDLLFSTSEAGPREAGLKLTKGASEHTARLPTELGRAGEVKGGSSSVKAGEATREHPSNSLLTDTTRTAIAPRHAVNMIPGLNTRLPPEHYNGNHASSQLLAETNTKSHSDFLKAQRRSEIERRAAQLSPPIPPNVLAYMISFKAALQIPSPLDEQAWEVLRPRLLAQREDAVNKAAKEASAALAVQAPASADLEEVPDALWDEAQGPLRARLVTYVDGIIAKQWDDGERVTKKTSARFAVEVLLQVRKSFYADVEKDATAARAAGKQPIIDPPQGPWTQKLTLENMKWIFDLKIRPLTEKHKKEPFFCHGCTQQKTFGLEGVIQHYAAKHDNRLGKGSIVVFWRAEWPAVSPFSPDPTRPGVAAPPKSLTKSQSQQKLAPHSKADDSQQHAMKSLHDSLAPPLGSVPSFVGSSGAVTRSPVQDNGLNERSPLSRSRCINRVVKETWLVIAHIPGAASLKAAILIHHVAKAFQKEFGEAAPLNVFMACIQHFQDMKPPGLLRNIQCKSCPSPMGRSQGYKFDDLLHHFKTSHTSGKKKARNKPKADWRTEMVLLPHINELRKLPLMLKGSPEAFELAADAMPWAFDAPQGPAQSQPQTKTQYSLRTRPTSELATGAKLKNGSAEAFAQSPPEQFASQPGFHITRTEPTHFSAAVAPPLIPTGPAAMTSGTRHIPVPEQPQFPSANLQESRTHRASSVPTAVEEEMEDAYSPPPPEAYQTNSPAKTFARTQAPSQQFSTIHAPSTATEQVNASERPSSYYHRESRPILRPATDVYCNSKQQSNGQTKSQIQGQTSTVPTGPRAARQPPSRPLGADRVDHPQTETHPRLKRPAQTGRNITNPQASHAQGNGYEEYQQAPPYHQSSGLSNTGDVRGRHPTRPVAISHRRSTSPNSGRVQGQPHYRERSPTRHYYEHPPPPPPVDCVPPEPVEYRRGVEYEVVRVRDPTGDYLLRRPIRQDAYGLEPWGQPPSVPVAMEYHQPHYLDPYGPSLYPGSQPQRATTVAPYPVQRIPTMAPPPQGYGLPIVYDEYDPRDAGRLPPPPQQQYRHGTEARY